MFHVVNIDVCSLRVVISILWFCVRKAIVDFFEKKVRRMKKLTETDPVGSASAVLMFSTQCCELAMLILRNDRRLIKRTTVVDIIVQHGTLCLEQVRSNCI